MWSKSLIKLLLTWTGILLQAWEVFTGCMSGFLFGIDAVTYANIQCLYSSHVALAGPGLGGQNWILC